MKKPALPAVSDPFAVAVRENIEIITGRRGGKIGKAPQQSATSAGIDVAAATGTLVTKKSEFDAALADIQQLRDKLNALISRLED